MNNFEGNKAEDFSANLEHGCDDDTVHNGNFNEMLNNTICHSKNGSPTIDDTADIQEDGIDDGTEEKVINSNLTNNLRNLNEDDVRSITFQSEEEAHSFYNSYARVMGFSIRKDRINLKANFVRSRKWVCSRQGHRSKADLERSDRKRVPRALTRVGCLAHFRVRYDGKIGKYVVTHFVKEHNHDLATLDCVTFLRSHRSVKNSDKAQIRAMLDVGMKTSQIMDFMVNQSGAYENVGFIEKDLYNHNDVQRREEIKKGDAQGALAYLCAKAEGEPQFFYKYDVDKENRLDKLFWADSRSRKDYALFGDVLVIDTTYKTNDYNKPFFILCGANNHFLTTIFGCALLVRETTQAYTWVLETFMEAMDNKKPVSIVSDGDRGMHEAIQIVLPDCHHRLCKWHLERNANSNVHQEGFCRDFMWCMEMETSENEFEQAWNNMVQKYSLQQNNWVKLTHGKRHMWAEAYLRGQFFAGMKSTQRCEGMNAFLNKFLTRRLRLYRFVRQYDRALRRIRMREAAAEAWTENTYPVLTTLMPELEKHGATIYTRKIFELFCKEIKKQGEYSVKDQYPRSNHHTYYLEKYNVENSRWKVLYFRANGQFKCSCMKLESFGIPCCHVIAVMKWENMKSIPESCVMQRWTRRARGDRDEVSNTKISKSLTQTARYGLLCSSFDEMCYYASFTSEGTEEAKLASFQLTKRMKLLCSANNVFGEENKSSTANKIRVEDPVVVRTKGNPGKASSKQRKDSSKVKQRAPKRCSHCGIPGHSKPTCPKRNAKDQKRESHCDRSPAVDADYLLDDDGKDQHLVELESQMPTPPNFVVTSPMKHNSTMDRPWGPYY